MENVTLNIYDLLPTTSSQSQTAAPSTQGSALSALFSSFLTPLGMGAYHTSIDVRGARYQFGAGVGIVRMSIPQGGGETAESRRFVPPNGSYRQSIVLGQTWLDRGEINAVIKRMRDDKFTGENYHMVNRNCNHFSETFAMALILGESLRSNDINIRLDSYPSWINRLAKTGASFGVSDGTSCDTLAEARVAFGLQDVLGCHLKPVILSATGSMNMSASEKMQKKVLTQKQIAALAKLKKSAGSK